MTLFRTVNNRVIALDSLIELGDSIQENKYDNVTCQGIFAMCNEPITITLALYPFRYEDSKNVENRKTESLHKRAEKEYNRLLTAWETTKVKI